jgi:hypothetical protein
VADQGRWFKVWVSILDDLDFQDLSLEDIGRWTLLGALTKLVGDRGHLPIKGPGRKLCEVLRVDTLDDVKACIARLPNVSFEEGNHDYGARTVTWRNWHKYQVDSTAYERVKRLRSKRRRDEKRRDEKRGDEKTPSPIVPSSGDFERFWAAYPKKIGKGAARRAWQTHVHNTALDTILTALADQAGWLSREGGKFIPNPATWLNQRRWEDTPPTPPRPGDDRTRRNIGGVMSWLERQGDVAHDPH